MAASRELVRQPSGESGDSRRQLSAGVVRDGSLRTTIKPPRDSSVVSRLWWSLLQYVPERFVLAAGPDQLFAVLRRSALAAEADLIALIDRDPAALGPDYVLSSYRCFRAVLAYRLAHEIHLLGAAAEHDDVVGSLLAAARELAERARVETGIEIHPAAEIGPRFVLDHGTGTVIGETVVIGSDCYLLQGVVLGAIGIADNPGGKRHPTLGSGVEVGAFAHVLGPITIGDGCLIDPHTVTTTDTSPHRRVRLVTQCQVTHRDEPSSISGVRLCPSKLTIWGTGLADVVPALCDDDLTAMPLDIERTTPTLLIARLPAAGVQGRPDLVLLDAESQSVRRAVIRLRHQWPAQQSQYCETCPSPKEPS